MPVHPSALSEVVLGHDSRQRVRLGQCLLVLSLYVAFAAVQQLEVFLGLIEESQSDALTLWNLGGGGCFYLVIRSGLNLRLKRERSLAGPQTLWAMIGITWAYAITGPARGAVILIMILVLVFTMFELTPARSRVVAAAAFGMLAGVMLWKSATDPERYEPRVEIVHLLFCGIVLAGAAALAARIGRLRERLERQRSELSQALERIRDLATRDDLTGLANRRAALDRLRDEFAVRGRPDPRVALALLDIDHFKAINDAHGHAVGDLVLRRFGASAQAAVRQGDLLARWGGEEFLLVMPATGADEARAVIERVRRALRTTAFDDVAPGFAVTCSAGISVCDAERDLEAAMARADAAMYAAKRAGRDRVVASPAAVAVLPDADADADADNGPDRAASQAVSRSDAGAAAAPACMVRLTSP